MQNLLHSPFASCRAALVDRRLLPAIRVLVARETSAAAATPPFAFAYKILACASSQRPAPVAAAAAVAVDRAADRARARSLVGCRAAAAARFVTAPLARWATAAATLRRRSDGQRSCGRSASAALCATAADNIRIRAMNQRAIGEQNFFRSDRRLSLLLAAAAAAGGGRAAAVGGGDDDFEPAGRSAPHRSLYLCSTISSARVSFPRWAPIGRPPCSRRPPRASVGSPPTKVAPRPSPRLHARVRARSSKVHAGQKASPRARFLAPPLVVSTTTNAVCRHAADRANFCARLPQSSTPPPAC